VSQPGVGLESAYSGPRVELRPPVYPSPVVRADLVLVGAVHLGGGGSQRRHGYRVGDCSAEGGTRLGSVRGALGSICFITRTLDGFTYERTAIIEWLRTNDTSPSTGAKLESKRLIPNVTVRCLLQHL